jgi:hypothetical protein
LKQRPPHLIPTYLGSSNWQTFELKRASFVLNVIFTRFFGDPEEGI